MFPVSQTLRRFSVGQQTALRLTKDDRKMASVISINVNTGSKNIMQLENVDTKRMRLKYSGLLPQKAIVGLWNALTSCSKNPKMLQSEAEQLKEKLRQRHFPASPEEVQEARRKIKEMLEAEGVFPDRNSVSQKVLEAFNLDIKKRVGKLLRNTRYNWKPLNFKTREHAAVYSLARIVPNYAEVRFVLQEFENNRYIPETVLDYGSGSGAAFWAAFEQWGKRVKSYQLIDPNEEISKFCMDVLRGDGKNNGHPFVHPDVSFRKSLPPSLNSTFDVIIVHRLLAELASEESRTELLINLWNRTNKYLVLVDGSCEGGYNSLMEARDYILMGGCELHREQTRQVLMEAGVMSDEAERILTDQQLSNYMRYNLIKNMARFKLEPGYVFAPCPHDQGCPKIVEKAKDVCSFSTRWNVLRADGRKQISNTEEGSFSYIIMAKGTRSHQVHETRLLTLKRRGGHVCCTVCTPFCGIQRFTLSKSMGKIYKQMKNAKTGRVLPVEVRTIGSDSEFDVYEEAVEECRKEKDRNHTEKNVKEEKSFCS
uniref:Methyltransferase-like protein 17, mitochondrial n=1 Tax=Setaria digitata TaxID=48799 RepID=A0A915PRS8_9BILA